MTKLEELNAARATRDAAKAAYNACKAAVYDSQVACAVAYLAYQAELKKSKE